MSIFEKPVLEAKADGTPGDPVGIFSWVDRIQPFVFPSSGYSHGSGVAFQLQWAKDVAGPWADVGSDVTIAPGDADKLLTSASNNLISMPLFVPYIRAKLSASPSAGSVTAVVYLRPAAIA